MRLFSAVAVSPNLTCSNGFSVTAAACISCFSRVSAFSHKKLRRRGSVTIMAIPGIIGIGHEQEVNDGFPTLTQYLGKGSTVDVADDMFILLTHMQTALKRISALVASPWNCSLSKAQIAGPGSDSSSARDAAKPLDVVANSIIKSTLQSSGKVAVMASEEEELPILLREDAPYVVVFDPLDGSRNIDASIPTGTIFGIYSTLNKLDKNMSAETNTLENVLQRGAMLLGAGYALYSSATFLCISLGSGVCGFTLDRSTGEFVLTHPQIIIPSRGQIYSVNDARYFDWPQGLQMYIDTIRQGKGQSSKKYSARYICSLVADFHRTLLYGGIAMNPRAHLRLVYEANPLSFLVEQAGGRGSDGVQRILDIEPLKLHQRLPLFLGSSLDIAELESFGDVQQKLNPGYNV